MDELSLAERGFRWVRGQVEAMLGRPVAIVAVAVVAGCVTAMVGPFLTASSGTGYGFDFWVLQATGGFGAQTQLALVAAGLLLVVDRLSAPSYRGQRSLLSLVAALAAVGMVANVTDLIVVLVKGGVPSIAAATLKEAWLIEVCGFLSPVLVAALACWIGVAALGWGVADIEVNGGI